MPAGSNVTRAPESGAPVPATSPLRTATAHTLYPGLLAASLVATLVGVRQGFDPTLVVMSTIFLAAIPQLIAQRLMPYEQEWAAAPKHYALDLLHMVSTGLTTEGWRALTLGALVWGAGALTDAVGASLWPGWMPWWAQFALAMLLGDFGAYWVHRSCHRYELLWRVHAMHHSSDRLYVFSGGRNHPLNAILAYGSQLLPLTLLGAPVEIIALMSVFTGVNGMLQHANIDMRHGVLNHVFATADLHRWHHATRREDSDTNFGSNLILWDWVFRTRHLPEDREIRDVGLPDLDLPENFLHHLASPFNLNQWLVEVSKGTPMSAPVRAFMGHTEPELAPQTVPVLASVEEEEVAEAEPTKSK